MYLYLLILGTNFFKFKYVEQKMYLCHKKSINNLIKTIKFTLRVKVPMLYISILSD